MPRTWLLAVVILALGGLVGWACSSESADAPATQIQPTPQPTPPTAMALTITDGGFCEARDCYVDAGSNFTLAVEVLEAPPAYVLMQTFIDYGVYDPNANEDGAGPDTCGDGIENAPEDTEGRRNVDGADRRDADCVVLELTYVPAVNVEDEIFWSDIAAATALRSDLGPGLIGHGGITGLIPPLPESNETGVMVRLEMSCPATATTVPISLLLYDDPLAGTSGSAFVGPDGGTKIVPAVSAISLHCEA